MGPRTFDWNRTAGFVLACLMTGALAGCGSDGEPTTPSVTLSVSPTTVTLTVGEEVTLEVTVTGTTASPTFTSSAESVAEVSSAGVITAISEGPATITVAAGGASADVDVTVTAPAMAITFNGFTRDGEPVDASNLSGVVTAEFDIDVPNGFEGTLEILFDDIVVPTFELDPDGTSATVPARTPIDGGGLKRLGIATSVVSSEEFEALTPNDAYEALAQLVPSGSSTPAVTQSLGTVTTNNPDQILIRGLTSTKPLIVVNGVPVRSGTASFRAEPFSFDTGSIPVEEIQDVQILNGAAATALYGAEAAGGVINITLRDDQDFPDGIGDVEGTLAFGPSANVTLSGGEVRTMPIYNVAMNPFAADLGGRLDAFPASFTVDNVPPGDTNVEIPGRWVGATIDLGGYASSFGFVPTDGLSGLDRCEAWTGTNTTSPEYLNLQPGTTVPETGGLELQWGFDCWDLVANYRRYSIVDPQGGPSLLGFYYGMPTVALADGSIESGEINPVGEYRIAATSPPNGEGGSPGIDLSTWRLSQRIYGLNGFSCSVGTLNSEEQCDPIMPTFGFSGFTTFESPTFPSETETTVQVQDEAGNWSAPFTLWNLYDNVPGSVTGTLTTDGLLFDDVGQGEAVSGFTATDDWEIGGSGYFADYGNVGSYDLRIGLRYDIAGTPYDGERTTSLDLSANWDPAPRSVQYVGFNGSFWEPQNEILIPQSITGGVLDTGRNLATLSVDPANILPDPIGYTFRSTGNDAAGTTVNRTMICSQNCIDTPTSVTFSFEALSTGAFEFDRLRLYKTALLSDLPEIAFMVQETQDIDVQDLGGFYQLTGQVTFDASGYPLEEGDYRFILGAFTPDNDALISNPTVIGVRKDF